MMPFVLLPFVPPHPCLCMQSEEEFNLLQYHKRRSPRLRDRLAHVTTGHIQDPGVLRCTWPACDWPTCFGRPTYHTGSRWHSFNHQGTYKPDLKECGQRGSAESAVVVRMSHVAAASPTDVPPACRRAARECLPCAPLRERDGPHTLVISQPGEACEVSAQGACGG